MSRDMDAVIEFIMKRWPDIGVILMLMIFASIAVWKISKYHMSIEDAKKKVNSLPCEAHKNRLNEIKSLQEIANSTYKSVNNLTTKFVRLDAGFSKLNNTFEDVNVKVADISQWIMKTDNSMIDTLLKKTSPYSITPIGYDILKLSGGEDAVDNNLDFFIDELKKINPETPFDVEEKSISIILNNTSKECFNPIKNYVYYSPKKIEVDDPETGGKREVQISFHAILNVMGVYLRDKYLAKYPEIEKCNLSHIPNGIGPKTVN
jgi:hypothetical protein